MKRSLCALIICMMASACSLVRHDDEIAVVSIDRIVDASHADAKICASFSLAQSDVATYFRVAEPVSTSEFDAGSIYLPCRYRGFIAINGKSRQWEIGAGGAGYLFENDHIEQYFLCGRQCENQLRVFIARE